MRASRKTVFVAIVLLAAAAFSADFERAAIAGENGLKVFVTDLSGEPIEGAMVTVATEDGVVLLRVSTDANGEAVIKGIRDGKVKLVVTLNGFRTESSETYFRRNVFETIRFGLIIGHVSDVPVYEISGKVLSATGNPVRNAVVILVSPMNAREWSETVSGADGSFRIVTDQPGHFILSAFIKGFDGACESLTLGEKRKIKTDLVLRLKKGN